MLTKSEMNERFDRARSEDIVPLLESLGCEFKGSGSKLRSNICPHCTGNSMNPPLSVDIADNYYFCFKCNNGGNPIDLFVNIHNCKPIDVLDMLLGEREETEQERELRIKNSRELKAQLEKQKQDRVVSRRIFLSQVLEKCKQLKSSDCSKSIHYLVNDRSIDVDLIEEALSRSRIAFLPDNLGDRYSLLRSCLTKEIEDKGEIDKKLLGSIAHRPILFPYAGDDERVYSMEFRSVDKPDFGPKSIRICPTEIPWIWKQKGKGVIINEGVLDGLSSIGLGFKGTVVSIPGITQWRDEWNLMLKDQQVIIIFDNDPNPMIDREGKLVLDEDGEPIYPGKNAARKLRDKLLASNLPITVEARMPNASATDINDALIRKNMTIQ